MVSDSAVPLFVYGTLLPDASQAGGSGIWVADAVRGRLFDLGPFPGLVDLDDPAANWVEGYCRLVCEDLLTGVLDAYEGVSEGLFVRARTTTRGGRRVWVYVYNRPLGARVRGPLTSWDGRRGVWPSSRLTSQGDS